MLTIIGALIVLVVWIGVGFMVLSAVRSGRECEGEW